MNRQGVLVVVGRKGEGKSFLVRGFLNRLARSIVIDTQGEYGGVVIHDPWSLAAYINERGAGPFRIAYRDKGLGESVSQIEVFKMLQSCRNVWLAIEEASKWIGPNQNERAVNWFFDYGRHNGISVVCVARRAYQLSKIATSQADTIVIVGRTHEPRDLDWIRQVGGDEAVARAQSLQQYEWDFVLNNHPEIEAILNSISEPAEGGSRGLDATRTNGADSDRLSGDMVLAAEDGESDRDGFNRSEGVRHSEPIHQGGNDADGGDGKSGVAASSRVEGQG